MQTTVRVICTVCSNALRIPKSELPDGLREDEVFKANCPHCETDTYIGVDEEKDEKK